MYDFDYHVPNSVAAAKAILTADEEATLLAGGMTLLPTMKHRLAMPSALVDLSRIESLRGITNTGGSIRIGSMTTHADVANSTAVAQSLPALADLAVLIGDAQVRNRGTIGGSVSNSDPAADYPAAILGLGATLHTDAREIPADGYFLGMFETALEPGEILEAVVFPGIRRAAYEKFPNPASRYAVVGVFVADTASGYRVAVTGAGPCAFSLERARG